MTTLLNNFYTVCDYTPGDQAVQALISINPEHEIFKGHFPGQPVVPGVCMVQIVKELVEESTGKKLLLSKGHQIKFLQLLVPSQEDRLEVHISWKEEEGHYHTQAGFKKGTDTLFKLSGILSPL